MDVSGSKTKFVSSENKTHLTPSKELEGLWCRAGRGLMWKQFFAVPNKAHTSNLIYKRK